MPTLFRGDGETSSQRRKALRPGPCLLGSLTVGSLVIEIAPQRSHVHATCSGSSFITFGHPHGCGGDGWSPSAIHQTISAIECFGLGLNNGPVPSLRSKSVRATPHGFSGSGAVSASAAEEALAPWDD